MLLLLADGASYTQVQQTVGCTAPFISKWKRRFLEERLAGLYARHEGRPIQVLTPRMEARILSWTQKKPTDGSTHWSTRRLAKKLGIHHMMVARTWKKHGLQPHRIEHYKASNDPDFETKAADIIGLYMNPPQHAAVFCIDEKTAIQALDRRDPILPLSPGRAERHGFEYVRHGTLSLYAAFDTKTGVVLGKTVRRHTSQEFVAFLEQLVASQKRKREIHVILDNLSAHKTAKVAQFLEANPKVRLHFTDVGDSSSPYAQGKHRPARGCHAPERKPGSRPGPHLDQNVLARCAAVAPASILGPLETRAGTNDEIMPAWSRQTGD